MGFLRAPVRPLKLAGKERGCESSHDILLNTFTRTVGMIVSALKWLEKEATSSPTFQNSKEANESISGNVSNK